MPDELKAKRYLGDGVYAGWDGFHIVLWVEGGSIFGDDHIALEPSVLDALFRYQTQLTPLSWIDAPEHL